MLTGLSVSSLFDGLTSIAVLSPPTGRAVADVWAYAFPSVHAHGIADTCRHRSKEEHGSCERREDFSRDLFATFQKVRLLVVKT